MALKSTTVNKKRHGCVWLLWIPALPLLFLWVKIQLEPSVTIHYAKTGKGEFKYIWNVQHRIYKGRMKPGGGTTDSGFIFPDDKFFMEIYWWQDGVNRRCVNITPKWKNTRIYLDENGNVDTRKESGTDVDRLKRCITDPSSSY